MRSLIISLVMVGFVVNLQAQSLRAIETDLVKSFKRIDYLDTERYKGNKDLPWEDSLSNANNVFAKKLLQYTSRFPKTIAYPFRTLSSEYVRICTSSDGLFRIYSWNTQMGGSMYDIDDVFQFKTGEKTISSIYSRDKEGDSGVYYDKIYTMKVHGQTYYLALYWGNESSSYNFEGLDIFAIENGKLNDKVKIIKTKDGLCNYLDYEYEVDFTVKWKDQPKIKFDSKANIIKLPIVTAHGKLTHKFVTYKFTGQYFEKVKK